MDTVVIYKANVDSVQKVLQLLRKEGFHPAALENPDPVTTHYSRATYLISIAVPREEAPGATSVLRRWEESRQTHVREVTGKLYRSLWYSTVIVVILALVFYLVGFLSDGAPLLFVVWLVLFGLLANSQHVINKFKRRRN